MDPESVYDLLRALSAQQERASEVAPFFWLTLLFCGAVCGGLLVRWIFRGGLSRYREAGWVRRFQG